MAKGINHNCANIWRGIARPGGWWSVKRVAAEWYGIYMPAEVKEHLATLQRGGFLELGESRQHGDMFAYTEKCHQLPGEKLLPVTDSDHEPAPLTKAGPTQINRMNSVYVPPTLTYRAGAMDHQAIPSLHMGKHQAFRSKA